MTIHTASCKPELIKLGRCMLQGIVGGVLAAMALMLFFIIQKNLGSFIVIFWFAIVLVIGGFLGAVKAIPFWALNCFLRSPLRVVPRIIMGGVVSTSLWLFLLIYEGEASNATLVISAIAIFLLSLPTSLLIGSRVRVEKFFSFRVGGLPLRILSTGALLFCVLACASWELLGVDVQQDIMFRYWPLVYLSLCLYLTFKPPRKTVLLFIALSVNFPVVLELHMASKFQRDYGWYSGEDTALFIFGTLLLAAWAIFIATQPGVSSAKELRTEISQERTALPLECDSDHECLGSRFAEWQQRVA